MTTEDLRDQIAETLAEHRYAIVTSPLRPACTCEWEAGAEWSGTEVHDLHVADAVVAVLGGVTVEEFGIRLKDGSIIDGYSRGDYEDDLVGFDWIRRTVGMTRRVGEWEEME